MRNIKDLHQIKSIVRVIPVTSDWPRLRRDYPNTRHVALAELHSGEYALIPYAEVQI